MGRSDVIARIKGLLNLARDSAATENEIRVAMKFAEREMQEHHLSEADLVDEPADQYAEVDVAEKAQYSTYSSQGKLCHWEMDLARFVCRFVGGVRFYYLRNAKQKTDHGTVQLDRKTGEPKRAFEFTFYGLAEDAHLARELFDELRLLIATMAKLKHGGCYLGPGRSYAEGFVSGVATQHSEWRYQEKQLAKSGTALVLLERRQDLVDYKKEAAAKWLKEDEGVILTREHISRSGEYHGDAHRQGREDGRKTEVSAERKAKLPAGQGRIGK